MEVEVDGMLIELEYEVRSKDDIILFISEKRRFYSFSRNRDEALIAFAKYVKEKYDSNIYKCNVI